MSMMVTLTSMLVLMNIRAEMSDHETMAVKLHETNKTRHLIAYESERICDTLALPSEGAHMSAEMVHAGSRSNIWRTVTLHG